MFQEGELKIAAQALRDALAQIQAHKPLPWVEVIDEPVPGGECVDPWGWWWSGRDGKESGHIASHCNINAAPCMYSLSHLANHLPALVALIDASEAAAIITDQEIEIQRLRDLLQETGERLIDASHGLP